MDIKRVVRAIPEEEETRIPIVERVGKLHLVEEKSAEQDPFMVSAVEIKKYSGTDSVFKRKITNELKKLNQSVDASASSKKIEDEFSGYDVFGVVTPPYNLDHLAKLYEVSAPHYAAVNAKVANIVGLGYKFVETPATKRLLEEQEGNEKKIKKTRLSLDKHREQLTEFLEELNEECTFTEILIMVWRDYETTGNAYLEISRKADNTIGYIGYVPSQTMRVRRQRDGYVQLSGNKVQFFANYRKPDNSEDRPENPIGNDSPNEIIHLKKHSPSNSFYGIPDIIAAQQAVAGNEFAARFNLDYFENKAIPRHLIILKGAKLGAQAESDLLQFFETNLKGQNHRTLFIPLPGDQGGEKVEFTIEPIEAGIQDASFVNFKKVNDKDIYTVHRVPETKVSVSGGVNIAVAKDADKTFKEQVCAPEQQIFEKKLNRLIKELTDAFMLKLNEMTLTDADTQSKIDERNIKVGIDVPNEVRSRDGKPGRKGGDEAIDLNAKDKIAQAQAEMKTQRERDSARSANSTDSNGESRNAKGEGRTTA